MGNKVSLCFLNLPPAQFSNFPTGKPLFLNGEKLKWSLLRNSFFPSKQNFAHSISENQVQVPILMSLTQFKFYCRPNCSTFPHWNPHMQLTQQWLVGILVKQFLMNHVELVKKKDSFPPWKLLLSFQEHASNAENMILNFFFIKMNFFFLAENSFPSPDTINYYLPYSHLPLPASPCNKYCWTFLTC